VRAPAETSGTHRTYKRFMVLADGQAGMESRWFCIAALGVLHWFSACIGRLD
jgi:tetrahydromethanopterin S-methyltransferase subunit C